MIPTNPYPLLPGLNKDTIILNDFMRSLLLEALCSRMDLIEFFRQHLRIELSSQLPDRESNGTCPWCGSANDDDTPTFFVNTKSGKCHCIQCNREDDFLSILCEKKNMQLHQALYYLTGCLEERMNLILHGEADGNNNQSSAIR